MFGVQSPLPDNAKITRTAKMRLKDMVTFNSLYLSKGKGNVMRQWKGTPFASWLSPEHKLAATDGANNV